eukprot:TRINITY_DN25562_c0_g1_i3.p1 TRINITY_DN25562_c0_g1~~TRINITY_DN25562_c0_g1_i3.p1  ORF type:complete len:123 (-),score=12.95 TRINITY_DN25562_c0_g1_i3:114-482(-)
MSIFGLLWSLFSTWKILSTQCLSSACGAHLDVCLSMRGGQMERSSMDKDAESYSDAVSVGILSSLQWHFVNKSSKYLSCIVDNHGEASINLGENAVHECKFSKCLRHLSCVSYLKNVSIILL